MIQNFCLSLWQTKPWERGSFAYFVFAIVERKNEKEIRIFNFEIMNKLIVNDKEIKGYKC
jgi:hypothetical protein